MDAEKYLVKLGERIKRIRISKEMSQADLAANCNFEAPNLRRIEAGKTNPTIKTLITIADALEVELSDLIK